MENASSPLDEKLQILKRIEDIGNRDFDGVDVTKLLKEYLHSVDPENYSFRPAGRQQLCFRRKPFSGNLSDGP
jgi:hypothetical protein